MGRTSRTDGELTNEHTIFMAKSYQRRPLGGSVKKWKINIWMIKTMT